ncbi:ribonuclease HI [Weissella uvarum]|uniref:ribonuclease HI family protein n=1 Tax=Weissella uvarum TaxID=1479233 RepID=UPI0019619EA1|nr:ribonuclease HI family protein [Weissella uvarum]MBM7617215.1 ribonuclease HI [Weissella uvarum]MCM0595508.1 ribonuclease HI family protein [Weissella uvarum]
MILKLFTDAATDPRTQLSAAGVIIQVDQQQFVYKKQLGPLNNHQAEFTAVQFGLHCLEQLDYPHATLMLHSDSSLVIDSLTKKYTKKYDDYLQTLNPLLDQYEQVILEWIPEKQNRGAHQLANQALHTK